VFVELCYIADSTPVLYSFAMIYRRSDAVQTTSYRNSSRCGWRNKISHCIRLYSRHFL